MSASTSPSTSVENSVNDSDHHNFSGRKVRRETTEKSGRGFYVWEDGELVGEADTGGR